MHLPANSILYLFCIFSYKDETCVSPNNGHPEACILTHRTCDTLEYLAKKKKLKSLNPMELVWQI